ncbi:MAG: DUF1819 family protein [Oscillospiraceae bacterium]|nr:DUF1819 family protein [Oscillospiraceae bacterium]
MHRRNYSAGAVKLSFWFSEFRKMINLLRSGKTLEEIKVLANTENIFSASTQARSKQIFSTVSTRVSKLSDRYYDIFEDSDVDTQKLIALISIINMDALFFEFMDEVYREKLIKSDMILTDADMRVFFHDKQLESDKIASWTDETILRLQKSYKSWLAESGLMEHGKGNRKISKPLIDRRLESLLSEDTEKSILNILTGVR